MSRRKQARPKSCKSEEPGDSDEAFVPTPEDTPNTPEDTPNTPEDSREAIPEKQEIRNNWILSETSSHRSVSPSDSRSSSSLDTGVSGATDVDGQEIESMDPSEVPFVIGVTDNNPYNCQFCEKAFSKKAYMKHHEQTHTAHMPYRCRHCPRLFRHKKSRERHERLHSSDRKYKCQICGVGYSRSDHLRNHLKSHDLMDNNEGFKCPVCQQNYMSASALMNHLKTHKHKYPEEASDLACFDCQQTFSNTEELQRHIQTHTNNPCIKAEKFECDICQEIFFAPEQLNVHTEQMHADELDFKCPICFVVFNDTQLLCQHIVSHNSAEEQSNEPEVTDSTAIMQSLLSQESSKFNEANTAACISGESSHQMMMSATGTVNSISSGGAAVGVPDVLICPYCLSDGFKTLESLELHLTSVHSVKPAEVYTCNYCNAPYPNLYSLHDHMTVVHRSQHGLDITYPCSMCVQRFHSLDALSKHKGIVHSQQRSSGIDAAFCNRCNMTLASPHSLEDHMATVHNIIMDKTPKALKARKKFGGKTGKEKDKSSNSLSGLTNAAKIGAKCYSPRDTTLSGHAGHLRSEDWPVTQAKSNKISALLAQKSASEHYFSDQSLSSHPSGLIQSNLTCNQCNATFHDAQNFAAHIALHAESLLMVQNSLAEKSLMKGGGDNEGATRNSGSGHQADKASSSKHHECMKCGATFTSEEHLEAHASLHYLCVSTEYGCSSCAKNFSKPDELQKHLMDIHAHHLYRCSLCKDIFDSKVNIQVHFAIKHSNECKIYKCVSCDIMFCSEVEWQVHVRVNHLHMSRPYRCLFCQKSFTSEVELQCHLTTHSKQFTCPMCDQAFHIEYLLDQHMQNCHGDTKSDVNHKLPERTPKSPLSSSASPFRNISIKQEKDEPFFQNSVFPSIPCSPSASSSSCTPRTILKSPIVPSPSKQPYVMVSHASSVSPRPTPLSNSMTPVSTIWKNTEPLHMCNICDVKFCDLGLLNLHKAQDHGLKATVKSSYAEADFFIKNEHDKFLVSNQTLLSALICPSSPMTSTQATSPLAPAIAILSCMFCSQTFKTSIEYNKHMKIHVNSGNLTCSICDETFTSASVLAEHKLTHCKIQQGNTCVICRVTMSSQEQFYMHAQDHGFEGSLLQCVVCRQTLSSLVELQMHGRHHFQTRPAFFTCCVCLKSFESKENLVSKLNSSGRTYYVCKPCYHGEAPLHTCSQCSEKFATAQLLEAHMQTHKASFQCIKCQQSFSSEYEIQLHVTTHMLTEGTQHECRLCGALFDSPARLQTHLIQHSFVGKDIICFVCNKIFESPQEIQVHALEHGSSFRKHKCSHCSQKFFFTAELDNHKLIYSHGFLTSSNTLSPASSSSPLFSSPSALSMATLASFLSSSSSSSSMAKSPEMAPSMSLPNKKLFEGYTLGAFSAAYDQQTATCSVSVSNSLEMVPSGAASLSSGGLQCPECLKFFSTGTALANHRKTHWKKDFNNSVRCSLCSQTFNSATSMQQHFFTVHSSKEEDQKKRKNFKCMMCDKECSTLSALQNHILSHRTGTSLPCSVCRKTFTSQRYLNLHMRVHKPAETKQEGSTANSSFEKGEPKIEQQATEEDKSSENTELCCPVCGQSFSSTQEIDEHIKTHEEVFTTLGAVNDSMEFSTSEHTGEENEDNAMEIEDR